MSNRIVDVAKRALPVTLALVALAAVADPPTGSPVTLAPGDVQWKADPRAPGVQTAVLSGDPKQAGLYVLRVKLAEDAKLTPHRHPDARYTTVLSGTLSLGFGEAFDAGGLKDFGPGSLIVIPANAPHYVWVKRGEAIVQDCGIGPTGSTPVPATVSRQ